MSQTHKYIPATQTPIMETAQVQVHGWLDRLDKALATKMDRDTWDNMQRQAGDWCTCAVGEAFADNGHSLYGISFFTLNQAIRDVAPELYDKGMDFNHHVVEGEYAQARELLPVIKAMARRNDARTSCTWPVSVIWRHPNEPACTGPGP